MKERPIIFSAPMVRAILEGRKTQARRVVKLNASGRVKKTGSPRNWHLDDPNAVLACPYGQPGDRLWVRETWQGPLLDEDRNHPENDDIHTPKYCVYRADGGPVPEFVTCDDKERSGWSPSIYMPRWASRILLEAVSVRVERLQDISEADAEAEGAPLELGELERVILGAKARYRSGFCRLWSSINGRESWDANPWVWVVEFRRVTP